MQVTIVDPTVPSIEVSADFVAAIASGRKKKSFCDRNLNTRI